MPILKIGLLNLHYRVEGVGPRILFIPGTASDLRQSTTIYDSLLAHHFQILSIDPRGVGQSNSPDVSPTMKTYSDDIKNCLDQLGWCDCICIGESFGGMIAQEFALSYSSYVSKLVLLATSSGGEGGESYPFHLLDLSNLTISEKADLWINKCDLRSQSPSWKKFNQNIYIDQYNFYYEAMTLGASSLDYKVNSYRQINARKMHDTYNRLNNLKIPTYICAGRFDNCAPIKNQLALLEKIPNSKLSIFDGSHMFIWQDPLAFKCIKQFLI
jgi:3-oxoadipate enol-lactonase